MSTEDFDIEHFPANPTALRMMSRISPVYEKSYVGKWIFEVMGMDMDDVRLRFEELRAQAFPETATWGLMYWEQRYGLPIGEGFDFEARRRPILARRRAHGPLNPKRVESILADLTGRDVTVTENVADYTFRVEIGPGDNPLDIAEAMRKIKRIKPSHQAYTMQVALQTMRVRTGALTETRLTVEVWPDSVTAVELAPAQIYTAGAVWPHIEAAALPGTVEQVSATAEVAAGAGANVRTTAQAWPETVSRAEATIEAQVMAGTQQRTVTRVWPGAVERVETKTGASGAFVEVHQTIEIWP